MDLTVLEFWAQYGIAAVFAVAMFWLLIRQGRDHKEQIKEIKSAHVREIIDIYTRRDEILESQSQMMELVLKGLENNTESIREVNGIVERLVSITGIEKRIGEMIDESKKAT